MLYLTFRIIASGANSLVNTKYLKKPPGVFDGVRLNY